MRWLVLVSLLLLVSALRGGAQAGAQSFVTGHIMIPARESQATLNFPTSYVNSVDCSAAAYTLMPGIWFAVQPQLSSVTVETSEPMRTDTYFGVICNGS